MGQEELAAFAEENQEALMKGFQEQIEANKDELSQEYDLDNEEILQQLYSQYVQSAYEQQNGIESNKTGGKIEYLKCLQAFKKGGMIAAEKCGCSKKVFSKFKK